MYTQFFRLSAQPFSIAPDPRFMFASHQHQEGLAHLLYGIEVGGGFVALTGEVGTGKTLLCHCLLQQLPATVDMALILNPRMDAIELLATICDELGIATTEFVHSLKNLVDALNKHLLAAHAKGRRTVLMIDEAQNLSFDVLEQIRLLTNLETTTDKLLQIILVGQPELQAVLNRPALRQLNQRITAHYHLKGLTLNETRAYIWHRLMVCQGDPAIFNPAALRKIHGLSGGIPRLINRLCDRALLGAYAQGLHRVGVDLILKAASEANVAHMPYPQAIAPRWITRLLGATLVLTLVLGSLAAVKHYALWPPIKPPVVAVATPPPVPTAPPLPPAPVPVDPLATLSAQQHIALSDALDNAVKIFPKTKVNQQPLDCKAAEQLGLVCFLDRSSWQEMLALSRPVVLELEISPQQKIFALLTGIAGKEAVLLMDAEIHLPITTLLQHWNGYYLLLWEPVSPGLKELKPYQTHVAVDWLRQHMGGAVKTPKKAHFFDQDLVQAVIAFQKQQQLLADGLVGARTFVQLQNRQPNGRIRKLTLRD